jgi:hypothetical protein
MDPRRSLTAAAYWVQLLYVPWIVVMFVLAYGVMSLLGAADETVKWTSQGALGWALTIAYAVVAALPNWLGAWLALRARRGGAGSAATVALWQNLIVGLAFTVFVLIDMM